MDVFADRRELFGIPNFLDVVSNAPFLVIGLVGLLRVLRRGAWAEAAWERAAGVVLFVGVALVALGSAWYHLAPTPERLAWDRLPMTLVFTSIVALVVGDRLGDRWGRRLLVPLVLAGLLSVVVWRTTGAIWPYALVQYGPMLALPLIVARRPPRYTGVAWLGGALAAYAVAKAFEITDARVYALTGVVSGHTLKHLAAAVATWCLLQLVVTRRPVDTATRVASPLAQPAAP